MTTVTGPDADKIKSMFASIAGQYDRANSVLSLGIHHLWRRELVEMSGAKRGDHVLDCATGTGDLAIEFKKKVHNGRVVGTDFCAEMLEPAPGKAASHELKIEFSVADVMELPFADQTFDIASISFGIRNVADPRLALKELHRVVKPGGRVMVLEFGQMNIPVVKDLYKFYSDRVLPKLGGLVTGNSKAYQYLQESSAQFPCREEFVRMMNESATFEKIDYRAVSLGIAYIYRGIAK